ncbi:MAG: cytochrome b/b6 domain-containing protein [Proteobacteria bacterium]|nr:cytochrome b/b6 domain-containing protein [Pseudomonadota bacterium]
MTDSKINVYKAWDLPTRLFHWINFLCIILLSILGLIMLNKGAIGISGNEAKIGLKVLHVTVGYVFAANLVFRLIWGFMSGRYSRWKSLFPGKNFKAELKSYKAAKVAGEPQTFVGHNPKGRLSVLVLLALLTFMMVTGMIRAGTDIYYPPFGHLAASFVAAEGVSPTQIKPYDTTGTDAGKMAELKAFKSPIGTVHIYGAYLLWLLVLIHVIAVVRAETGGEGTLISAMFSGKKHLPRKPEDE